MATATKKTTKFNVGCPKCGQQEANLAIDLNNLNEITCGECNEVYSAREACELAAEQLKRWQAVQRWVEMAGEAMASAE